MASFERGTIVRVPFPYTDKAARQHRPALVVSDGAIGSEAAFLWVVMITSAENRRWPEDIALIDGYRAAGLPAPSLIRTVKIATIEARQADPLGRIDAATLGAVERQLRLHLHHEP
ncbi:type II toxin-antitoxin system PemK/MazF family toxin [Oceanibaculum pacificum]|uniref:Growth inhibitor PemK n=1 Tax=Oceanibaculum pacificum TaxID=580166 RepID=A0A154WGQ3_9PROT|nr:type II toxin-antitoxin system PemK/MazF family toxin [Oceanibaculum pacificum]KZD12711.1 growth inhibitor PemK [Oceanibaculum pacificum]